MVKKNSETVDENGNPITVTVWEPEFTVSGYVDYTGNWVFDAKKEGILNASSEEGNIQIKEKEGNIGLGVITAPKGTVEIATDMDSDILDRRSEDQKEAGLVNITAGNGNSSLTGKRIGTETDPITVDIRGKLLVDAIEDIRTGRQRTAWMHRLTARPERFMLQPKKTSHCPAVRSLTAEPVTCM